MALRGRSLPPSAGSVFRPTVPAIEGRGGRSGLVAGFRTPRRGASRRATTFPRFIKHVLHVKSASGTVQVKTPKHPISDDTLPHSLTHIPILMVCVMRVFHTNGGSSSGGTGSRRMSLRNRPKARSYTPDECGAAVYRLSEKARCAGRLDAFEPPSPRRWVSADPASPPGPGPAPGPVLLVCANHNHGGLVASFCCYHRILAVY